MSTTTRCRFVKSLVKPCPMAGHWCTRLMVDRITSIWCLLPVRGFESQVPNDLPVIKVPIYVGTNLRKAKRRAEIQAVMNPRQRVRRGDRSVTVIGCSQPKYNYYLGQTYHQHDDQMPIFSKRWQWGDRMTFNSYSRNPSILVESRKTKSLTFADLGLEPDLCSALKAMDLVHPTTIQASAIPHIMERRSVVCSAETGSGKTVAYLAPMVQMIAEAKKKLAQAGLRNFRQPLGLIAAPSRELVEQVGNVAKRLAAPLGVGVKMLASGLPGERLTGDLDLVVTTVGLVQPLIVKGVYKLNRINHLVIDEADSLFDDTFSSHTLDLINNINFKYNDESEAEDEQDMLNVGAQLICVSATMPSNLDHSLGSVFDVSNLQRITTDGLHRMMPHVKQVFLKIDRKERHLKLLELVTADQKQGRKTMIFSNRTKTSYWIYNYLRDNGIFDVMQLNQKVPAEERLGMFNRFQEGEFDVISCTDLGSRGLDTRGIGHVINYDCPHFVCDYIHRAGRTGRVGSPKNCLVTTFVSFKPDQFMLQKLEYAVRRGRDIDSVNGNIQEELRLKGEQREASRKNYQRRREDEKADERRKVAAKSA